MRPLFFIAVTLCIVTATGCGAASSPTVPPNQGLPAAAAVDTAALQGASTLPLLYVTSARGRNVTIYSFDGPKHVRLVGTLNNFSGPTGLCVDKNQNVYIVDNGTEKLYKYARGGTKPIATLRDPYGPPISCAVDPLTGNLAVTTAFDSKSSNGSIAVYAKAKGMPKKYVDQNFGLPEYCAYDRGGNLFVDGYSNNGTQLFEFAELPKGGKSFNEIRIQGAQIFAPGGVVWDDPHVLLADSNYKNQSSTVMYELKVIPPNARVVRATHLSNSNGVQQFWKQGTNIIAPEGADFVPVYDYPSGVLVAEITKGVFDASAAAVSLP